MTAGAVYFAGLCGAFRLVVSLSSSSATKTQRNSTPAQICREVFVLKRSQDVHEWSSNVPPTASIVVVAERSPRDCWITIAETAFEHLAEIVVVDVRMTRR